MNLVIISILILLGIVLIVMIIKAELAYKKEKKFNDSLNRDYHSHLKK